MNNLGEWLDRRVAHLKCYEPSGHSLDLSVRDLLQHTLVLGATGSGKSSSIINPLLEQLVYFDDEDPQRRVGLLVIDLKGDREVEQLLARATSGNPERLKVITPDSIYWIDPFEPLRRRGLAGLDASLERIASGVPVVQANAYWHTVFFALIRQVLATLYLANENFEVGEGIELLSRQLLAGNGSDAMYARFDQIQGKALKNNDSDLNDMLDDLVRTQQMWDKLDPRTRSNFQSMAPTIIDPLCNKSAGMLFSGRSEDCIYVGESIEQGDILLLRMNGFADAEAASFVARMVKADFYQAITSREGLSTAGGRLAGLVVDEWSLVATGGISSRASDVSALQLIRSKGAFIIAAAQSLAGIDLRLGPGERRAALANFNNLLVMRSREEELEAFASRAFGYRTIRFRRPPDAAQMEHFIGVAPEDMERRMEINVPIITPGSLPRLETGQAFVSIGPQVHPSPLWLIPTFDR